MEEVWKDVKGFEGRYQVSNLGRVRSLDMVLEGKNWKSPYPFEYQRSGKVLKSQKKRNGYYYVCLMNNGKPKYFLIHRLVALAFIPNPNKLPCINHKDEDKANNVVSNLEWCDRIYNLTHDGAVERRTMAVSRPIEQLTKDGQHVAYFRNANELERLSGGRYYERNISRVAKSKTTRHSSV